MSEENRIQVFETTNITRLSLAKLALDNAEIAYESLYENTLQLDGVYAMGQNGAQLVVDAKIRTTHLKFLKMRV